VCEEGVDAAEEHAEEAGGADEADEGPGPRRRPPPPPDAKGAREFPPPAHAATGPPGADPRLLHGARAAVRGLLRRAPDCYGEGRWTERGEDGREGGRGGGRGRGARDERGPGRGGHEDARRVNARRVNDAGVGVDQRQVRSRGGEH
jgi:hypothetical protein